MVLTNEILELNGFQTDHPERKLKRYHYENSTLNCYINLTEVFTPQNNMLSYEAECMLFNGDGMMIQKVTMLRLLTVEDLQKIISFCGVDKEIVYES